MHFLCNCLQIKNKRCPYDYVEVMACPSACSNGGGQVRAREGEDPKEILSEVEELYAADMVRQKLALRASLTQLTTVGTPKL